MSSEDFDVLCKDIQKLLGDQDAIGSLDRENGFFSGLLVSDPYSREKLEGLVKVLLQDKGARVTLAVKAAAPTRANPPFHETVVNILRISP